jgi:periplasmic protein TonB
LKEQPRRGDLKEEIMIVRYAVAVAVGAAVTFALLFVMQFMIDNGRAAITGSEPFHPVDFVRVERDQVVETRERKPEKPPKPEARPEVPAPEADTDFSGSLAVSFAEPALQSPLGIGSFRIGVSDGEYLPIVKVEPIYPARALARRLEGYVMVEFTVTQTGAVRDVTVVESTAELFERSAIDAALKFKYKPRVIDGQAVEVPGVRNLIVFSMESSLGAEGRTG